MWWSALKLGTWTGKEFALKVGKLETQISGWVREDPKPGWEIIKLIAGAVDVSPAWLDDPRTAGAEEPELFAEWLTARRRIVAEREEAEAGKARRESPKSYTRVTSKKVAEKGRKRAG